MVEADVDVLKGQARLHPASCILLPLYLCLPQVVFSCSNQGHFSHATITGTRTSIDLEIVFLIGLHNTLLKAHAKFLGLLKTNATMTKRPRCSSVKVMDKKQKCTNYMEVVITWMCLNDLMSKMSFISHLLKSCDEFRAKLM